MRRGKEEKRKMQVVWKMHCGVEWRGNASGEENCIVEWSGGEMQTWRGFALSGGELKWSGVEVEWKWRGINRFSSFDSRFFDFRFRGHSAIHREEGHIHIHIWVLVSRSGSRYASAVDTQRRRITPGL